jgi:hypothetical protein
MRPSRHGVCNPVPKVLPKLIFGYIAKTVWSGHIAPTGTKFICEITVAGFYEFIIAKQLILAGCSGSLGN